MKMLTSTIENRHTDAWNRLQLAQEELYNATTAFRAAERLWCQREAEEGTQAKFHEQWQRYEAWCAERGLEP